MEKFTKLTGFTKKHYNFPADIAEYPDLAQNELFKLNTRNKKNPFLKILNNQTNRGSAL